jgi:hypothetical protein
MPIFILYIIPLVIFILLLAPKFIGLRRLLKNADSTEKKEEILNDLKEAFEKSTKFSASLKELINIKPVVLSQIWFFVKTVSFIYMLPVFLLRMSLIFRLGSKSQSHF